MSPILRDIANEAGVSESTVSRALTGRGAIAPDTREQILSIAKRLGYNRHNQKPRSSNVRRGLIGVVIEALHNSFFAFLIDRVHYELDLFGFDMILIIDDLVNTEDSRKIQGMIDASFDGVLISTASIRSPSVDLLVERGIPTVLAIRSNKGDNVDVVESDNRAVGVEAVRHLLDLGHRRIGFILGPPDTSTSVDRLAGSRDELEANGIEILKENTVWGSYSHDSGYSGIVQLMNLVQPPSAIFCANDVIAIGALEACQKLGIQVPKELSIIGVDDIPMASWSMISLTTIRQSIGEIGALAARRLVARIKNGVTEPISHDILPASIVRRRTTGLVASKHPHPTN